MRRYIDYESGRKVYVGPYLDPGVTSDELRAHFGKFGSIQAVWVARNPPGFAFVTFDDVKDAESACRSLDDTEFCGKRIRVEIAHGPRSSRMSDRNKRRGRSRSYSPRHRRSPSYSGASPPSSRGSYGSPRHYRREPSYRNRDDGYDRHRSSHGNSYSQKYRRDTRSTSRRKHEEIRYKSRSKSVSYSQEKDRSRSFRDCNRRRYNESPACSVNNNNNNSYRSPSVCRYSSNHRMSSYNNIRKKRSASPHKPDHPTHSSVSSSNGYPVDASGYSAERM